MSHSHSNKLIEEPILLVFAGPNGSGKSTLKKVLPKESLPEIYINADDITKEMLNGRKYSDLSPTELDTINLKAASVADQRRQEAILSRKSFATETVLSTHSKIDLMRQAAAAGYKVHLVYVTTQDPDLNVERIKDRVNKGGHDVDPEKVETRYYRAMDILPEAIQAAHCSHIYNNSLEDPRLIIEKSLDNVITIYPANPPEKRSIWTATELSRIKETVLKIEEKMHNIDTAPKISELKKPPHSKTAYEAYAKESLSETKYWGSKNDELIAKKMIADGFTITHTKAALTHSPSLTQGVKESKIKQIIDTVKPNNSISNENKKSILSLSLKRDNP